MQLSQSQTKGSDSLIFADISRLHCFQVFSVPQYSLFLLESAGMEQSNYCTNTEQKDIVHPKKLWMKSKIYASIYLGRI